MPYKDKDRRRRERKARYANRRNALIAQLGGCCKLCGCADNLEFDHPNNSRTYEVTKMGRGSRIVRYEREAKEGKIRLLCKTCNSSTGAKYARNNREL